MRKGDSVLVTIAGEYQARGTVLAVRDGGYDIEIGVKSPRGEWSFKVSRGWIDRAEDEDFWSVSIP